MFAAVTFAVDHTLAESANHSDLPVYNLSLQAAWDLCKLLRRGTW